MKFYRKTFNKKEFLYKNLFIRSTHEVRVDSTIPPLPFPKAHSDDNSASTASDPIDYSRSYIILHYLVIN